MKPNAKGRRKTKPFLALPRDLLESENWKQASHKAKVLIIDVASQYRGNNNGDLCAAMTVMKPRGWKSESSMREALAELLHYGFLEKTRQGGKHKASLYAITWAPIDECKGKLEVPSTKVATNAWKEPKPPFVPKRKKNSLPLGSAQCTPTVGAIGPESGPSDQTITPTIGVVRRKCAL
jgi:hypothetical protein